MNVISTMKLVVNRRGGEEWNLLKAAMTFDEYGNYDTYMMTSELFTKENKMSATN